MDNRDFETLDEMHRYMIKKWNEKVKKNDEVYILGDLSMGNVEETTGIIKKLNGKKYMIIGNHDRFLKNKEFDRKLFVDISNYMEINDGDKRVVLCHYPVFCYNHQYRMDVSGNPSTVMLYGHVHDTLDQRLVEKFVDITKKTEKENFGQKIHIPCEMINCFCMYSDYTPLSLNEWISLDKKRRKEQKEEP